MSKLDATGNLEVLLLSLLDLNERDRKELAEAVEAMCIEAAITPTAVHTIRGKNHV